GHPLGPLVRAGAVAARGAGRAACRQGPGLPAGTRLCGAGRHRRHPAADRGTPAGARGRRRPGIGRAGAGHARRRPPALTALRIMPLAPDLSALPPPSPPPPGATPAGARSAGRLRARLRHWFHSRLPRTDTLALTQRNVYILPTRAGAMLALTLVLLLVASINYQLTLGYLLTFLLAGCAAMGMHVSHANLRGLSLHLTPPAPVHAGTAVQLEIRLAHPGRQTRYGIGLSLDDTGHGQPPAWTDVPGQGNATVHVAWQVPSRGWHPVPVLSASTRFP